MKTPAPIPVDFPAAEDAGATVAVYADTLLEAYGPQNWWPARTRFEVIVGAFLTQNTSWTNVEHAMKNLRRARVLNLAGIRNISVGDLELLVRPSGYFRQKARNIKGLVEFIDQRYAGSLQRMFARPTLDLRAELLDLNGIGPETADSILLYAGNHPAFVVDVYTRRILARHHIMAYDAPYERMRELVEQALVRNPNTLGIGKAAIALPKRPPHKKNYAPSPVSRAPRSSVVQAHNELHALIVRVGSSHCRKQAQCDGCPLQPYLPAGDMRQ